MQVAWPLRDRQGCTSTDAQVDLCKEVVHPHLGAGTVTVWVDPHPPHSYSL